MSSRRDRGGDGGGSRSREGDDVDAAERHDVALWLDRFQSASRPSDVESALEGLLASSRHLARHKDLRVDDWPSEAVKALVQLLQTSQHNGSDVEDSGCPLLSLQVISALLGGANDDWAGKLLLEHSVVAALVDVSCSPSLHASLLSRVLSIETLDVLAKSRSTTKATQTQLLQANGLVRLAELFNPSSSESTSMGGGTGAGAAGPVSLAMLQLAQTIVEWPAVARNWMFVDVPTALLSTFVRQDLDGDDTRDSNAGSALLATHPSRVQALHVLTRMLQQDASFALLLLETTPNLHVLLPCLDLRRAAQYRDPSLIPRPASSSTGAATAAAAPMASNDDDEDDLDALLQSGSAKAPPLPPLATTPSSSTTSRVEAPPVPTLVEPEVQVIRAVMEFLEVLLEQESVRTSVWKKHEPMGRMLWDMALLTPPAPPPAEASSSTLPPHRYYPCAMPPVQLQSDAFLHCAAYWNHTDWLPPCLDRLLYLTCTGAGAMSKSLSDRFQISQSAVHLLRQTLSLEAAQDMMVSTKVGMGDQDEPPKPQQQRPPPTSVRKLVYTIMEHLDNRAESAGDSDRDESRAVFLVGATTALLVVLHDNEASKSMLLSLEPQLMPKLLQMLDEEASASSSATGSNRLVIDIVLHFLARWIDGTPVAMQALLQRPEASTVVAQLSSGSGKDAQSLVWLLLGLSLDQIMESQRTESAEPGTPSQQDWGGWTSSAIVDTFKARGISRVIQELQQYESSLPWVEKCRPEQRLHQDWCKVVVLRIRKRIIQAVLQQEAHDSDRQQGESEAEDAGDRGAAAWSSLKSSSRSLSVLVQQQTGELEDLRSQLSDAKRTLSKQEQQLEAWKRRVESTPTQLDDMLNEYTAKTSDLVAQVSELREKLELSHLSQQQELEARDEQIAKARRELEDARDELSESNREKETMADELKALSQAYSSLEEEYRRQLDHSAPDGEASQTSQAQGEGSEEIALRDGGLASTEVASLRADNARLKQDVKAAEDWMAMAYERMNAMQQETQALQTQLENAQMVGTASQSSEKTTELVLSEERSKRQQLESELMERKRHDAKLADELERERALRTELDSKLTKSFEELEQVGRQNVELDATIEALRRELEAISSSKGEIDDPVQVELSHTQAELRQMRERDQEEIYKLESKVRDLEARLGSGLGEFTIDDIRKRDEDIQQLQEANNAAQEWMAKAMEQNQVLASKVAELTQEKSDIWARAEQLEARPSDGDVEELRNALRDAERRLEEETEEAKRVISGWQEAYNTLEANRQDVEARLNELRTQAERDEGKQQNTQPARATELERVIEELNRQLEDKGLSAENQSVLDLQSTIEALKRQLSDQEEEARAAIDGWQRSYIEIESQLKALQSQTPTESSSQQVEELTRKLEVAASELKAKDDDALAKSSLLENLQSSVDSLQTRLDQLQLERDEALVQIQAFNVQARSDSTRFADLEEEAASLRRELEVRDSQSQHAAAKMSELEKEVEALQRELASQELAAKESIYGWQRSYEETLEKCQDLERRLEETLSATGESGQASRSELEAEVADLKRQLENRTNEIDRVSELEAALLVLQEKLLHQEREAKESIAGWQRSHEEEAQRCQGLNEKLAEVLESNEKDQSARAELETLVVDLRNQLGSRDGEKNRVTELEALVSDLQQSLSTQEHEANESIAGWKGSYEDAVAKSLELEEKVADLMSTDHNYQASKVELEALVADLRQQIESRDGEIARESELEAAVSDLQQKLAAQEGEAIDAITGWQRSYEQLVEKCRVLEEKLAEGSESEKAVIDLEALVSDQRKQLDVKDAELSRLSNLDTTISELEQKLATQEVEAMAAIAGWQRSYEELVEKCRVLEEKMSYESKNEQTSRTELESLVSVLRSELQDKDADVSRLAGLETTVSELQQKLTTQEGEAIAAIEGWQRSYEDAIEKYRAFEEKVESARAEHEGFVSDLRKELDAKDTDLTRLSSCDTEILELKQRLATQERETVEALAGWQRSYEDLLVKCRGLEDQVAAEGGSELKVLESNLRKELEDKDAEINRLSMILPDLEQKLANQESAAVEAIEEWQRSYEDVLEKCRGLEEQVAYNVDSDKATRAELETLVSDSPEQLEGGETEGNQVVPDETAISDFLPKVERERDASTPPQALHDDALLRNRMLEVEIGELRVMLDSMNPTAVASLTAEVESLRVQLQEQETEATNAIVQWEDSYRALESELLDLKQRGLLVEEEAVRELQEKYESLESDADLLRETNQSLQSTMAQLETQHVALSEELRIAQESRAIVEEVRISNSQLRLEIETLRQEMARILADKTEEIARATTECSNLLVQKNDLDERLDAMERLTSDKVSCLERTIEGLRAEKGEYDEQTNEALMLAQERLSEANAQIQNVVTEKARLEEQLKAVSADSSARTNDLEQTIVRLQNELAEHDELANEAINQWQESLSDAEARIRDLDSANVALRENVKDLQSQLASNEVEIAMKLQARCKQLEDELSYLVDQAETYEGTIANRDKDLLELQRRMESSDDQIVALTEERDRISAQLTSSESQIEALKSDFESRANKFEEQEDKHSVAVQQLEGQLNDLKSTIHDLEAELESQAMDAQAAIAQWESSYLELQELAVGESRGNEGQDVLVLVQREIAKKQKLISLLGDSESILTNAENACVSIIEAKEALSDLNVRLESSITRLVGELSASHAKVLDLTSQLDAATATVKTLQSRCSAGEAEVEESRLRVDTLERTLQELSTHERPGVDDLKKQIDDLAKDKLALEQERDSFRSLAHSLEDDVRGADDMLRLHAASLDSDRAVTLVVETLQKENEDLRSTMEAGRSMLNAEKDARRAAESEAKRLTSDLAAILGVHDSADYRPEIRMRAMQAREAIYRREEEEIEQLKDALTAALDELDVVRNVVHEAEERASKASIQASLYEQEIVTAKTDFKLLAEKMDEMRDAESTKREALESRVNVLQNQCSVLRRQHALAADKLQNDLNHALAEKDRLLQALKDSERTKDAMIRATTSEKAPEGNDLFVELTKLRLEKAELLVSASEEASKFERRLREARAAELATRDADVILERELRATAEASLEATRRELAEIRIRSDLHPRAPTLGDLEEQMTATELRRELGRLQDELEALSGENGELRDELEALRQQSREQLDALRDECRHAKARAAHLEREGRVEAEIQAEVARLRARAEPGSGGSGGGTPRSRRRPGKDPALGNDDDGSDPDEGANENWDEFKHENVGPSVKQMTALIQEQDRWIKEGKAAYTTLVAEHDELLVVLAEVHNVQTTLKQALARTAGVGAVEEALRAAEAMTQSQRDGLGGFGTVSPQA